MPPGRAFPGTAVPHSVLPPLLFWGWWTAGAPGDEVIFLWLTQPNSVEPGLNPGVSDLTAGAISRTPHCVTSARLRGRRGRGPRVGEALGGGSAVSRGCPARGRGPRERLSERHLPGTPASAGSARAWSPGLLPGLGASRSLSLGEPGTMFVPIETEGLRQSPAEAEGGWLARWAWPR